MNERGGRGPHLDDANYLVEDDESGRLPGVERIKPVPAGYVDLMRCWKSMTRCGPDNLQRREYAQEALLTTPRMTPRPAQRKLFRGCWSALRERESQILRASNLVTAVPRAEDVLEDRIEQVGQR